MSKKKKMTSGTLYKYDIAGASIVTQLAKLSPATLAPHNREPVWNPSCPTSNPASC